MIASNESNLVVQLVRHEGLDIVLHALRIGDSDHLIAIQADANGNLFFVPPAYEAGFRQLSIHFKDARGWTSSSVNPWSSPVSIEYLELPQIHSVLPTKLPAGPIARNGAQHIVAVVGDHFTSNTECLLDGVLSPTRWLAKNIIECEIPASGRAGEFVTLLVKERGLYLCRGDGIIIRFTAQAYVYRVEPPRILIGRVATLIKVYIADTEDELDQHLTGRGLYYCKFGSRAVRAH